MRLIHAPSRPATPGRLFAAAAMCVAASIAAPADAQFVQPGFDDDPISALGTNDGSRSQALPFDVNIGGTTFDTVVANNNGVLSFGGSFEPYQIDTLDNLAVSSNRVLIAPFYANVDTSPLGSGNYDGGIASLGLGNVDGRSAFGVTWDRVGFSDEQDNLLSTFQVLIVDRSDINSGDFDIVFNYDDIEWTAADPADLPAQVGVATPDGSALLLDVFESNHECSDAGFVAAFDVPGTYTIPVRSGRLGVTIVPSPTAAAAGLLGLIAIAGRRRR